MIRKLSFLSEITHQCTSYIVCTLTNTHAHTHTHTHTHTKHPADDAPEAKQLSRVGVLTQWRMSFLTHTHTHTHTHTYTHSLPFVLAVVAVHTPTPMVSCTETCQAAQAHTSTHAQTHEHR